MYRKFSDPREFILQAGRVNNRVKTDKNNKKQPRKLYYMSEMTNSMGKLEERRRD
jgi:hypothetical protein